MNIDATGFVDVQAGSVASANAVFIRGLLSRGHRIRFFTKPSFVDPRGIELSSREASNLSVVDCTNWTADWLRQCTAATPVLRRLTNLMDVRTYNQLLVTRMRTLKLSTFESDLVLWMGDYVRGRVVSSPSVGFLQGPPATDARSIEKHRRLIVRLAGLPCYLKLWVYAKWRMGIGHPDLSLCDHIIVGSQWSRSDLMSNRLCRPDQVHAIPYPIDLTQFRPNTRARPLSEPLRLLWLGRFVPRKRLDLFLDGLELAIRAGCNVSALVIGSSGFVPNYERLLIEFPFPERLEYRKSIPRTQVPGVLAEVDAMVQPSEDENFGSSVAEALACGVPAIVGVTNGTADYICKRSIHLVDDQPGTMANAIVSMENAKRRGELLDPEPSREVAEKWFDPERVIDQLEAILKLVSKSSAERTVV